MTIFLTTHRLEEAEKLCDRVAILNTTLRTVGTARGAAGPALQKRARRQDPSRRSSDPSQVFARIAGCRGLAL